MVFKSHCGYNILLQSSHMNKTALCIVFTTCILQGGWLCHFSTYVLQSILALLLMFVMVVLESEISSYKCTTSGSTAVAQDGFLCISVLSLQAAVVCLPSTREYNVFTIVHCCWCSH